MGQTLCCKVVTREALCLTYVCCCRHFLDPPVHVIHWLSNSCKPAGAAVLLQVTGTETRPTAEPESKGHQRRQVVVERVQPGEAQAKTTCGHKVTTQAGSVCAFTFGSCCGSNQNRSNKTSAASAGRNLYSHIQSLAAYFFLRHAY